MKVVYCGSFDPIHKGHVALARYIASLPECEEVWMIPSRKNPLKERELMFSNEERLAMVRTATAGIPRIRVSDIEMGMPSPSYTIDTLEKLDTLHPGHEWRLLIGADNWASFSRWRRSKEIMKNFGLVIYPRPGYDIDPATLPPNVTFAANAPQNDISSTMVRHLLNQHTDPSALTGPEVAQKIKLFLSYKH